MRTLFGVLAVLAIALGCVTIGLVVGYDLAPKYRGPRFTLDQCTAFETGLQETKPRYVEDQNQQKVYTFVDITAKQTVTICQKTEWK